MVDSGEGRDAYSPERRYTRRGAGEFIGMVFHGQTITHIDAMSHYSWNGLMYNGVPSSVVASREGAQSHSIEAACEGIITRGVLLDLPRLRGVDWLDPAEPVMPEDQEAAEQDQGVRLKEGDILLTRTGNYLPRLERGASSQSGPMAAHQVACATWFRERGIAMMGTDTSNDARPNPYKTIGNPLHTICLVSRGLWFIDNANLEELAVACSERGRYEFMLTLASLRLRGVDRLPSQSDRPVLGRALAA